LSRRYPSGSKKALLEIYRRLYGHYGPQHWWPGETPWEVMAGAILTQNTAWANVEKALANLKEAGALSPRALRELSHEEVATLIRPSGYYRAKASKLKALARFVGGHGDDLAGLFSEATPGLREKLLEVHGIGEETADSILLYAARRPVFVVDAYTRRIFSRLGLGPGEDGYRHWQGFFMENLPLKEGLFNEYHALLVRHGKEHCQKKPRCPLCPVKNLCAFFLSQNGL
jgi:endonuclease-3 related protein